MERNIVKGGKWEQEGIEMGKFGLISDGEREREREMEKNMGVLAC